MLPKEVEKPPVQCNYTVDHSTGLKQESSTLIATPSKEAEQPPVQCKYTVGHNIGKIKAGEVDSNSNTTKGSRAAACPVQLHCGSQYRINAGEVNTNSNATKGNRAAAYPVQLHSGPQYR
nr:uncharacterized protein LOC129383912 [Dermacentor andersoni]